MALQLYRIPTAGPHRWLIQSHRWAIRWNCATIDDLQWHLNGPHIELLILAMCALVSRVSTHNVQSAILLYQFRASVCLSVRHIVVLYPNECTYRQTLRPFSTDIILIFEPHRLYQISRGTISVDVKCAGWRISTEIAVFSRKRHNICPLLIWITNRKS